MPLSCEIVKLKKICTSIQLWDMSVEYTVERQTKGHLYNYLETHTTHYLLSIISEILAVCCELSNIEE